MITRRGLFKGVAAIVGSLVLKPLVPKSKEYSSFLIDPKYISKSDTFVTYSTPNNHREGWFHKQYGPSQVNLPYKVWVADDIYFADSNGNEKYYKDGKQIESPWEKING